MPREAEPSINERQFVLEALQQGIRLDGRSLDAIRDLQIDFGDDDGVVDVRLGKTRVLTKMSASLASPNPERKFDGLFTITAELSPLASPAFEVGRQSDLEAHLTTALDTLLRRSNAISTESLCLIAGQRIWHLRATLHILSQQGSLLTCSSISLLAALLHYRIPASEVRGGELTVFDTRQRDPVPLALLHHPLCLAIAFFPMAESEDEGQAGALTDPTLIEEQVSSGSMIVGSNREGEVVLIEKGGGMEVDGMRLLDCIAKGVETVKTTAAYVFEAIDKNAQQKDQGGAISRELRAENER